MKATDEQRQRIKQAFDLCLQQAIKELTDFRYTLIEVTLKEEEILENHDFDFFGWEAFDFKIKEIHDRYRVEEDLMKEAKNLIDDKYQ